MFVSAEARAWQLLKDNEPYIFVDGKGDSGLAPAIAAMAAADGVVSSKPVRVSTTSVCHIRLTLVSTSGHPAALAAWPVDEQDNWTEFFDQYLGAGHPMISDSVNNIEHTETGTTFGVFVMLPFDKAAIQARFEQAFPGLTGSVESWDR